MRKFAKCDCGHANPVGTLLCESCGCPTSEVEEKDTKAASAAMRYEGRYRRSYDARKSWLYQIWAWFSSVRVAIWLILALLVASALGTILEREPFVDAVDKKAYYTQKHGWFGTLFYTLRLTDVYSTPWFIGLMVLITISLIVCSLDRVVPLHRALYHQSIHKDIRFFRLQRFFHVESSADPQARLGDWLSRLQGARYTIRREGNVALAEKGRFSRWGPYINHVGLIIFFTAVALRLLPGWYLDRPLRIPEGTTVLVPRTPYTVGNDYVGLRYYDPNVPNPTIKEYRTIATVYERPDENKPWQAKKQGTIMVNDPMKYNELELFQTDVSLEFTSVGVRIVERATDVDRGTVTLTLDSLKSGEGMEKEYPLAGGLRLRVLRYYPHVVPGSGGTFTVQSPYPEQPGFTFELLQPGQAAGEGEKLNYIVSLAGDISSEMINAENTTYLPQLATEGLGMRRVTILTARVERAFPLIILGAIISIMGLFLGFYGQHRRIWLRVKDGKLYLGAHTNKYTAGLERDLKALPLQTPTWQKESRV